MLQRQREFLLSKRLMKPTHLPINDLPLPSC